METACPLRVAIADDHPVFRFGLRAVLTADASTQLAGEAASGDEAIELAIRLRPDVVLMDLDMPGVNGIEATRQIVAACPDVAILVLTMTEATDSVLAAMQVGARGYLLKGAGAEDILRAIRAVAAGDTIFGPMIAERLLHHFGRLGERARNRRLSFPELTPREHEVLTLIAGGFTNPAIAEQLYLSSKTVRNHVSSIFGKLQVTDRGQAIVRAREAGLG